MKIDKVAIVPHTNTVKNLEIPVTQNKDFASAIKIRDGANRGIELPKNTSRELVQNFAEWYFKQGKTYENSKSYKLAISAYEKSNSVQPDVSKANSIDGARSKEFKK